MTIINTSDYVAIPDVTRRNWTSWQTGQIYRYRDDESLRYEWDADSFALPAVQNPESLASPWQLDGRGITGSKGDVTVIYWEFWSKKGTPVTL